MANTKKETVKKTNSKTTSKPAVKKNNSTKKVSTTKKTVKPVEKKEKVVVEEVKEVKETSRDKMTDEKKKNIIMGVIIAVAVVVFFGIIFVIGNTSNKGTYVDDNSTGSTSTSTGDAESESANIKEDEMGELTSIGIDEYLSLKEADEYSVIYIGRPTCSHCQVQKPLMQNIVYKYGVKINYLDTDTLDEDGISKLQQSDDFFSEGWGTPLTLIVKGDDIVDKSEGETSLEDLTTLFKKYGLINE